MVGSWSKQPTFLRWCSRHIFVAGLVVLQVAFLIANAQSPEISREVFVDALR